MRKHGGIVGVGDGCTGHHTPGAGWHSVGSGVGVGVGVGVSGHSEHSSPTAVETQIGQSPVIVMFAHVPSITISVMVPEIGVQ